MSEDYGDFLRRKDRIWTGSGIPGAGDLPASLYEFQARLTAWALAKGRAALFADTGLGKSRMQVAWASKIPGRVLILAPLCVGPQTIREGRSIGVTVAPFGQGAAIEILNYEQLHHVDPSAYAGVVLDESSILKSFDGKTRTRLIAMFRDVPYRLCCTATPAPNDQAELANHCEFLGIMTRGEMLATFFVHDEDGWRLKGHAAEAFYRWLASWGMFLRRPSDLGFSDEGYLLPPLNIEHRVVGIGGAPSGEYLFAGMGLGGIRGRLAARRDSLGPRLAAAIELVSAPGPWIVWCGLNEEQDAIAEALGDECVSIQGSDDTADKEARIEAFISGQARILVTKPRIAGFGLNLQHCSQMVFLGLGDSYETYYQSIRRCYRFGQTRPVEVRIVVSEAETEVVTNVRRKEQDANATAEQMIQAMAEHEREEISATTRERADDTGDVVHGQHYTLHRGDCVEVVRTLPDQSVDLSIFSPPFLTLYTYSNSPRDMGNSSSPEEFLAHYRYLADELLRVTKPGRICAVHCADVGTTKANDGVIGLRDLPGELIRVHEAAGWVYHGRVTIDKDPQAQAIRTHSKALLFVQLRKDSSWLRPAIADYILVFRAPGDNAVPIKPDLTNDEWIEWARPIWYGIRESDTLNVREARAHQDDKHIVPLQLGTIERCVRLWSNEGDLILSPFAGIGSEGYVSVGRNRRFVGVELKREYFDAARRNLESAETTANAQGNLFDGPNR